MISAIFRKELRQHGMLALSFIGACPVLCALVYFVSDKDRIQAGDYLWISFFASLLYTAAAAGCVYAAEHDENTFGFLRKLPLSQKTIAQGKTLWVLASSAAVFVCTLLSSCLWGILTFTMSVGYVEDFLSTGLFDRQWLTFFPEVFLWGLFWTTRCRRQTVAVLLALASPVIIINLLSIFCQYEEPTEAINFYFISRIIIAFVVAIGALWGMFHWFDFDTKRSILRRLLSLHPVLFRYPKRIQSPFFALWHQHIRSASIVYPFGLICFALMIFLCLSASFVEDIGIEDWFCLAFMVSGFGIIYFWGTIFAADQRNHSYRFLMRLGIHEGTLWWSRLTIPFLCYIPVLLAGLFLECSMVMNKPGTGFIDWVCEMFVFVQTTTCIWLAPVALGSFCSIFFPRQVMSVGVTFFGFLCLLFWMMFGGAFATSSLVSSASIWVFPLCLGFLYASRWRARYWLRDM